MSCILLHLPTLPAFFWLAAWATDSMGLLARGLLLCVLFMLMRQPDGTTLGHKQMHMPQPHGT